MIDRPSLRDLYSFMSIVIATRSTCKRASTGCLLASGDLTRILAVGYNGGASGRSNDECTGEVGRCGCLHCEVNCLVKAPNTTEDTILFVTGVPCMQCAKLIVNASRVKGIREVVYTHPSLMYRKGVEVNRDVFSGVGGVPVGTRILTEAGIKVTSNYMHTPLYLTYIFNCIARTVTGDSSMTVSRLCEGYG